MKQLGGTVHVLQNFVENDRIAAFKTKLGGESFREFLLARYPHLAEQIPEHVTAEDFAHADGFAPYAEHRLALCARCPAIGGLCDNPRDETTAGLGSGHIPSWNVEQKSIDAHPCKQKWPEHMLRKRVGRYGVPDRLLSCSFESYKPRHRSQERALAGALAYVSTFEKGVTSSGLMFSSQQFGVGKSHIAVAILRELSRQQKIQTARFEFVPSLIMKIRRAADDYESFGSVITDAFSCDLLVLDDLGAQKTTDWVREQMLIIANERWSNSRPTIITTNANAEAAVETLGDRAYSKLISGLVGFAIDGPDQRRSA